MASGEAQLQRFHQRCGRRITLFNGNRTAARSVRDFSHALVFSADPLVDDVIFEVVIEKKNHSWGGSIEIGVTAEPPDRLEVPSCATAMRNGSWVMSGIDVRKDGMCLIEFYGEDLETLVETDRVGVMRTSKNELVFYVNGRSQGVAAHNMPKTLWALVDLYGRCVQVSIYPVEEGGCGDCSESMLPQRQQIVQSIDLPLSVDVTIASTSGIQNVTSNTADGASSTVTPLTLSSGAALQSTIEYYDMNDRIRFHTRCGSLVKLSTNFRCAERRRPMDEFNNGVVMTHRPLKDNELFEIRIDKLVDKWSGSIEVGVTTHNPSVLHFPATMTNMRSGTIMMSGCGILTNGKGTRRQYGEFNLDELREGDRVGMMRKSNSNLHYYINGQDQGVAATRVSTTLWGVIDLYGMTIKVTIVDRDEREQQNLVTRRNNIVSSAATGSSNNTSNTNPTCSATLGLNLMSPDMTAHAALTATSAGRSDGRLTFHPTCGSHATVTHSGRTALRPNASDDFNNGVVLTRRPLRPNELFQVRLERVVTKWAGSVEMGVTTHSAEELEFPFTMTNVRSGTWMMTGNGVMHNGITVIEQYGQNLDRLQVGDRVGVVRKDDGTLHFWVNGIDQGPAATNVPEHIYGVIDLYGQAAQASIVDTSECASPDTGNSTISNTTLYSEPPLRFHSTHGKNVGLSNGGLTASRPNALAEFNDAVVFSNRPLRQRELFEVMLETMIRHWSGNIEIGVTDTRPEDIQLAPNATDLNSSDTIILCGSMIFHNRKTIRTNVVIDLDTLSAGARVGVMRNGDFLHFFIDGIDQGPAVECHMTNAWAVLDLYGQCAQVTITLPQPDIRAPYATSENSQSCQATSVIQPALLEANHRWSSITENVTFSKNSTVASRTTGSHAALSRCLLFSETTLSVGSPFEFIITSYNPLYAGCLNIGITDLNLSDEYVRKLVPTNLKRIPANIWYLRGNELWHNSHLVQHALASLEWLRKGDRITLELTPARTLRILLNAKDMNIQIQNLPNELYVTVELMGSTMAVQAISSQAPTSPLRPCSLRLQDSLDFGVDPLNKQDSMLESIESESHSNEFSEIHGKNIRLSEEHRSAMRTQSYNQALVYVAKPLCKGDSISIKVDAINKKWSGSIGIGVVGACPQPTSGSQLPSSIMQCKRPCWVLTHDFMNINGQRIECRFGATLERIQIGTVITLTLSHSGSLIIIVGSSTLEDMATGLPHHVYPVFDLYGKCERISLININNDAGRNGTPVVGEAVALEHDTLHELDNRGQPHCEKANLEVHEKETEQLPQTSAGAACASTSMNRSVMESVSENLLMNISIKNRSLEQGRSDPSPSTSSCCLRESLQLQHNTNLNIQRSQSTQRFQNAMNVSGTSISAPSTSNAVVHDTNKDETVTVGDSISSRSQSRENLHDFSSDQRNNCGASLSLDNAIVAHNETETHACSSLDACSMESEQADEITADRTDDPLDQLLLMQQTRLQQHREFLRLHHQPMSLNLELSAASNTAPFDSLQSISSYERKNCAYLKLVQQFRVSLVLPQTFFQPMTAPICFCKTCNAQASEKLEGWVYYKLNQQTVNSASTQHALDSGDWLPLYYMTRVDKIRAILDHGQPLPMEVTHERYAASSNQKDEPGTRLELHYSPNGSGIVSMTPHKIRSHAQQSYSISSAFEVYVRRQSLCSATNNSKSNSGGTAGTSSGRRSSSDLLYNNDTNCAGAMDTPRSFSCLASTFSAIKDMSWFTKEAGACVITALILKLDKLPEDDIADDETTDEPPADPLEQDD